MNLLLATGQSPNIGAAPLEAEQADENHKSDG